MAKKKLIGLLAFASAFTFGMGALGMMPTASAETQSESVTLVNGVTYQENFTHTNAVDDNGTTITSTGVKFTLPVSAGTAKFQYWDTMTTAELANGFALKMLPADNTVAEMEHMKIFIEDAEDETKQIIP